MDVSSKEFVVYGINERKQKIFDKTVEANRDGLRRVVKELGEGPKLIVFEAGNQMKWIALAWYSFELKSFDKLRTLPFGFPLFSVLCSDFIEGLQGLDLSMNCKSYTCRCKINMSVNSQNKMSLSTKRPKVYGFCQSRIF
jgi:hypothetical protein